MDYKTWKNYAEKYDKLENVAVWKEKVQCREYNYKYI